MRINSIKVFELPDKFEGQDISSLKTALKDFYGEKISFGELEAVCIKWAYDNCMDDFTPIPFSVKPKELVDFDAYPKRKRDGMDESIKLRIKDMRCEWLNEIDKAINKNNSNFMWLRKMRRYFNKYDEFDKLKQVEERMDMYERSHLQRKSQGRFKGRG